MPVIARSSFRPANGLSNGHLQTIFPVVFRKVPWLTKRRERLELADGDFLDLYWADSPVSRNLVILTHGLEGTAADVSIQGMAAAFLQKGWNVVAWNMRGCGEPNRLLRFYHSGATEDLAAVVHHILQSRRYEKIALVGFSLGGNLLLKYLGDLVEAIDPQISGAVAFSVPCDLQASVDQLDKPGNRLYMRRFLGKLRNKIREKKDRFPDRIDVSNLSQMRSFHEFDAAYTAPLHGFSSAVDYWTKASCGSVLERIGVPCLLVNALDDPFLSPACFPMLTAERSATFFLETPESGGHCGFVGRGPATYWSEQRATDFLEDLH